jgi:hypothetical protein
MTLYNDVRMFIFLDIAFIVFYGISFIIEFGSYYQTFSFVLIILTTLSYLYLIPYFSLVLTSNASQLLADNAWNLTNLNLSIIIWSRNLFLVITYTALAVAKTAHVDLYHILVHLNAFQKVSLLIFLVALVVALVLAGVVVIQHKKFLYRIFNTIVATIYIDGKEESLNVPIEMPKAHLNQFSSITLIPPLPSSSQQNTLSKKLSNKGLVEKLTAYSIQQ